MNTKQGNLGMMDTAMKPDREGMMAKTEASRKKMKLY
jgi:hypothetical protein